MEVTPDILSYGKISQDQIAGFPCRVFEGTRQLIIIARKYSKTELAAYYRFSRNKCKTEATFEVESAAHSGIFMKSTFHLAEMLTHNCEMADFGGRWSESFLPRPDWLNEVEEDPMAGSVAVSSSYTK